MALWTGRSCFSLHSKLFFFFINCNTYIEHVRLFFIDVFHGLFLKGPGQIATVALHLANTDGTRLQESKGRDPGFSG